MRVQQIHALGPALVKHLGGFADCFISPDTHYRLKEDEKDEPGLDHFQVRKSPSVLWHLRITAIRRRGPRRA